MAVPKNRLSQTRQKMRRANWKLTAPGYVECPQCHEAMMPHHVCPTCGYYKGKQVVNNTALFSWLVVRKKTGALWNGPYYGCCHV